MGTLIVLQVNSFYFSLKLTFVSSLQIRQSTCNEKHNENHKALNRKYSNKVANMSLPLKSQREKNRGLSHFSKTDRSMKAIEIRRAHTLRMMTQMQLPATLSTHPHYSLHRHLRLWGAEGTETSLFNSCFSLWEPEGLNTQLPILHSNWFTCLELKTFMAHRLPTNSSISEAGALISGMP